MFGYLRAKMFDTRCKPKIGDRIYDGAVGSAGFLCESFEYLSAKPGLTTKDMKTLQERRS
jgi:type I restriction enzyme M protein